jgi:hypothetical protein
MASLTLYKREREATAQVTPKPAQGTSMIERISHFTCFFLTILHKSPIRRLFCILHQLLVQFIAISTILLSNQRFWLADIKTHTWAPNVRFSH